MRSKLNIRYTFLTGVVLIFMMPLCVLGHASDRGFVLLLPTDYYVAGGTLAVLFSVLLVSLLPIRAADKLIRGRSRFKLIASQSTYKRKSFRTFSSLFSTMFLLVLVTIGWIGSSDPLANPLPLTLWTMVWVLLTLLHALFGHLWAYLNPWLGIAETLDNLRGSPTHRVLSNKLHYWPALVQFAGFAWFELVSLSPEDPSKLATVVLCYWSFNLVATLIYGPCWLKRCEPFSVFFYMISLISPFTLIAKTSATGTQNERCTHHIQLTLPGVRALRLDTLHWSCALFVLMTLATVSFDGLSKTFWWLHLNSINPLEFGGRSTVTMINTIGLTAAIATLISLYLVAVLLGWALAGKPVAWTKSVGLFAIAIIPISLGYHFSHYLTQLLVNGQYAINAFANPLPVQSGSNISVSTHGLIDVTTSFLSNKHSVTVIWQMQVAALVSGHILSVLMVHLLAARLYGTRAITGELPLALLMVLYTWFGLWLLSTPTGL